MQVSNKKRVIMSSSPRRKLVDVGTWCLYTTTDTGENPVKAKTSPKTYWTLEDTVKEMEWKRNWDPETGDCFSCAMDVEPRQMPVCYMLECLSTVVLWTQNVTPSWHKKKPCWVLMFHCLKWGAHNYPFLVTYFIFWPGISLVLCFAFSAVSMASNLDQRD